MTGPERGIGRIGTIQPQTFGELAQHVKQVFGLDSLRMVHYQESGFAEVYFKSGHLWW